MKIAFLFHVYKDAHFAYRLVGQLLQHFPDSDILAIFDGDHDIELADFLMSQHVTFKFDQNLKAKEGGKWCQRYHEFFLLNSDADVLIRLDPDTYIHRPLKYIPHGDIFGALNQNSGMPVHVRGAFSGFKRSASKLLVESNHFLNPFYKSAPFWYPRYSHWKFPGEVHQEEWISLIDPLIAHVAMRLGLKIESWSEVQGGICFREQVPDNSDLRYAATHPVR